MAQIVDLTNPQGRYSGSFNAIANILNTIGQIERLRQERSLNAKVINAVAQGMGTRENIARIMVENQPTYSTGATGFLQKIASSFAPPSMIEAQFGQGMMQTGFRDPLQQAYLNSRIKANEALAEQRAREADPQSEKSRFSKASNFMRAGENLLTSAWQEEEGSEAQTQLRTQARDMIQEAVRLMKGVKNPSLSEKLGAQLSNIQDEDERNAKGKSPTPVVPPEFHLKPLPDKYKPSVILPRKTKPVNSTKKPTIAEFEANFKKLLSEDRAAARRYYNKWKKIYEGK